MSKIKIIIILVVLGLIPVGYSQKNTGPVEDMLKVWDISDIVSKEPTRYGACNFVAEGRYYRKLLEVTNEGYYLVQDFYAHNDLPYTEPYIVMEEDSLISTAFENPVEMAIHGKYITDRLEGDFIYGKPEGMWVEYDDQRNVIFTVPYVDGLLEGLWKKWDSDGNLIGFGQYEKGLKIGSWEEYASQGYAISSIPYVNGKKHGCAKFFNGYSIDNYKQEVKFENGQLKGRRTWNRYGVLNSKLSHGQTCD